MDTLTKLLSTLVLCIALQWSLPVGPSMGANAAGSDKQSAMPSVIQDLLYAQNLSQRVSPRGKDAIYQRLLAVATLVVRDQVEWYARRPPGPDVPRLEFEYAGHLNSWVEKREVRRNLLPDESTLLDRAIGNWSAQDLSSNAWTPERFAILFWALNGLKTIPPYDVPTGGLFGDPIGLLKTLDTMSGTCQLRSRDELVRQYKIACAWVERANLHREAKRGTIKYTDPLILSRIEGLARQAVELGAIPTVYRGDFPTFGEPYRAIIDRHYITASWIAVERRHTLAWLLGLQNDWRSRPIGK